MTRKCCKRLNPNLKKLRSLCQTLKLWSWIQFSPKCNVNLSLLNFQSTWSVVWIRFKAFSIRTNLVCKELYKTKSNHRPLTWFWTRKYPPKIKKPLEGSHRLTTMALKPRVFRRLQAQISMLTHTRRMQALRYKPRRTGNQNLTGRCQMLRNLKTKGQCQREVTSCRIKLIKTDKGLHLTCRQPNPGPKRICKTPKKRKMSRHLKTKLIQSL